LRKVQVSQDVYAIVDADVFAEISQFNWFLGNRGYVVRNSTIDGKRRQILLHRQIVGPKQGNVVDHINGDKLDNRKVNLRECLHKQNIRNQKLRENNISGYKGVAFKQRRGHWIARITVDGKMTYLGSFDNPHDAARMYNFWAIEMFGEFARLNVIKEEAI
jgi:hypothetical protein